MPLATTSSNTRFLSVLESNDRAAIAIHLSGFREMGKVNFGASLSVPAEERISAVSQSKEGYNRLLVAIGASLKSAFSNINLRIGLTEDQIVELADQIIIQSQEDNLSLEDVLLFLQELISGRAGKIYDRMDIPTFFELFENYRQQRHIALLNIRYEQEVNHKALGWSEREPNDEKEPHREALKYHLQRLYKEKQ